MGRRMNYFLMRTAKSFGGLIRFTVRVCSMDEGVRGLPVFPGSSTFLGFAGKPGIRFVYGEIA